MIKVMIVEDMIPIGLKCEKALSNDPDIQVIANVQTGKDAVAQMKQITPDVILMDVEMETPTAGLDAAKEILVLYPNTKIIILTVYEDDETVFTAFQIGVSDYLIKKSAPEEMIKCVKDAYQGLSPIRPVIAQKIRREFQRIKNTESSFLYCLQIVTQMTQSEIDILNLMCEGYSKSQISKIRCVEMSTIKTQVHSILKKFDKASMSEVIQMLNELQIMNYIRSGKVK